MTNRIFMDAEFIEGPQPKKFLGITYGHSKPTIDLISIGMVNELGQAYYAVSKDFNLNHAWNNEWVRENVIKRIYLDFYVGKERPFKFSKSTMRLVLRSIGKSNETIGDEVRDFIEEHSIGEPVSMYSYKGSHNWVAMTELPNMGSRGLRDNMYCKDLKQMIDALASKFARTGNVSTEAMLDYMKTWKTYPKNSNEHNALADANWNKALFEFIKNNK